MKKSIIFITVITFITIISLFPAGRPAFAFKYTPPPPPEEPPIPPPEEPPPKENPPAPPPSPSPTPCIPNWCFVEKTECCFDPVCIFLGETTKASQSRCNTSKETNLKFLSRSSSTSLSLFSKIILFVQSIFKPLVYQVEPRFGGY